MDHLMLNVLYFCLELSTSFCFKFFAHKERDP